MSQPSFSTQRLLLRPRTLADTDACMVMDENPEVTRFVTGPWGDPAAHRAFIIERTRGPYSPGLGYWSLFLKAAPETFIGWILLIPEEAINPDIEIGWRLERSAWGNGFGTEAARAILTHAFTGLTVERVIADINPANVASIKVAEKLGLRANETVRRDGTDHIRYTLTRTAYDKAGL